MAKTVLIVDDDPTQRRLLQAVLEKQGFDVASADGGEAALERLVKGGVDVMLLDLVMPGMDGMDVLEACQRKGIETPVIVLTAHGGIETVVAAMRAGAADFFIKPASPERITVSVRNVLKMQTLTGEVKRLKKTRSDGSLGFEDMIAGAPAMRQVVRLGQRAATSSIPILITGESGVGKELVAGAIRAASERADKPFVAVNCGAIPENLVESTLFGHEKGSFTGATGKHMGKFQEADGGTLFLDEIGELPLDMQVKLLRALQEGEVDPVGSKAPVKVDVRIISATNRDLTTEVEAGRFREDLFYRLNVFPIEVPSLRSRKEDVAALVRHFITRFNAQENRAVVDASPETMAMLTAFDWPGNVRQLENSVFRAVVLCEGDFLQPEDFPQISGLVGDLGDLPPPPLPDQAFETQASDVELPPVPIMDEGGHLRPLESIERDLIEFAIETYAGRMAEVARRLGLGRSTLYRKVREYDLDVDQARSA
ncbi:sigma-54-dependent transcriptional regulator [Hyphobacterium sp.]|uniref:sigma-54-dependent transcriptional regulator n=1 Tax=Hyphobacterium sp. TaxID=2004662 RepID=UPI003BAB6A34